MKTWETLQAELRMIVGTIVLADFVKDDAKSGIIAEWCNAVVERIGFVLNEKPFLVHQQPEPKECSSTLKPKVEECEHVYSAVAGQNRHMCFKCGYKRNPKDTITIDGCEYSEAEFNEAALHGLRVSLVGQMKAFKSALQKVSDKGEV